MKIKIAKCKGIIFFIFATVVVVACEHKIPVNAPQQQLQATFSSIQTNILTPKCAVVGCHIGSSPTGNMNLQANQAYGNLIDVQSAYGLARVRPGNPDNSVLYQKVLGNSRFGIRMPQGPNSLSQQEQDAIRDWILADAPNN